MNTIKRKVVRSPKAPSINLEDALKKAEAFYDKEPAHSAPAEVVRKHIGYSASSGIGKAALASLRGFGLVEKRGKRLALSPKALAIIRDRRPGSNDRADAIRSAAMQPKVHADVLDHFGGKVPSDENLRYYLLAEKAFTEKGADQFIEQFKATVAFAGFTDGDILPSDESAASGGEPAGLSQLAITGGFQPGKDERRPLRPPAPRSDALTPIPTMNQDTFTLDEGKVVLQWPASISAESYEDLKDWLDLMGRRVKRAVVTDGDERPDRSERATGF